MRRITFKRGTVMKNLINDFKKFISKGNVLDMAVGVVIGSAFSAIISALVNGILYPLLSLLGTNETNAWVTVLREAQYDAAGNVIAKAVVIDWGAFVSAIVNFLLIALVLFTIVKFFALARKTMDVKGNIQEKLDKNEPLLPAEERLLRKWQKRDPENAPKKKEETPPAPPAPTETERLLSEILQTLQNKEN